jgi:hypothetical protein
MWSQQAPSLLIKHTIFSIVGLDVFSWDVLDLAHFTVGTFWGLGRFEAFDIFNFGCFGVGTFWGLGLFWGWDVYRWDLM